MSEHLSLPNSLFISICMPKFCVSIFTESERIINSHIFNHPTIEEMEKEIQNMLYQLTFAKPLTANKQNSFTKVQEMAKDNIKWLYYTFEKRNKKIKYFVILEAYKAK